jgi:hypothetical protein
MASALCRRVGAARRSPQAHFSVSGAVVPLGELGTASELDLMPGEQATMESVMPTSPEDEKNPQGEKTPEGENTPADKNEFAFPVCPFCKKAMQLARLESNNFGTVLPQIRIFECTECGRSLTITA